ncbi:unnamed protein product [Onchocerca flexuosa]|uniref:Uncharacterized protein n=1 Tax=Onchocerca flexuosa TaxID=387005 RepID=A0A183HB30_9BILA|nr:unnamed protein product [Onchocerca flexuosa]
MSSSVDEDHSFWKTKERLFLFSDQIISNVFICCWMYVVINRGRIKKKEIGAFFDKYCSLFMKRFEQQNIGIVTVGELFAIAIKYGFKETSFRHFKEIAARWMCRRLEVIMRNKGLYGLPHNLNLVNIFVEIDDLECSLDYSKWLEEFMTPFFRLV